MSTNAIIVVIVEGRRILRFDPRSKPIAVAGVYGLLPAPVSRNIQQLR